MRITIPFKYGLYRNPKAILVRTLKVSRVALVNRIAEDMVLVPDFEAKLATWFLDKEVSTRCILTDDNKLKLLGLIEAHDQNVYVQDSSLDIIYTL